MPDNRLSGRPVAGTVAPMFLESMSNGGYVDETAKFRETIFARPGKPDLHESAASFALDRGRETGFEHLVAIDTITGTVHAGTLQSPRRVSIPNAVVRSLANPSNRIVLHHNHPSDGALSPADIAQLGFPGLRAVVAVGHEGGVSAAVLTTIGREWLRRRIRPGADLSNDPMEAANDQSDTLRIEADRAADAIVRRLRRLVGDGAASRKEASAFYTDLTNRVLHGRGLIDYATGRPDKFPQLVAGALDDARARTEEASDGKADPLPDRPAGPVRECRDMAGVLGLIEGR